MLKYQSTPKPVRIRIESGGEEHFSLDSLLKCFNPTDLLGKKNELLRWLDFQGNEGKLISEELRTIEDFDQNVFGVYRAFFHQFIDENHINRIEELYALWAKEEGRNFSYLKAFCYQDDFLIEKLYLNKQTKGLEDNWFGVISDFVEKNYLEKEDNKAVDIGMTFHKEIKNPNLLYYLGVLYKDKDDISKAKICLEAALKKGSKMDTQKTLKEIEELLSRSRFYGIDKDKVSKYIDYLFKNWTYKWDNYKEMKSKCDLFYRETHHIPLSEKEKEIIELAFNYRKAQMYSVSFTSYPSRRFREIKYVAMPKENDFLKKEKDFIRCLSKYDEGDEMQLNGKKEMERLAKDYIPAKYISDDEYMHEVFDEDPMFRNKASTYQIEFVLRHIFDFE